MNDDITEPDLRVPASARSSRTSVRAARARAARARTAAPPITTARQLSWPNRVARGVLVVVAVVGIVCSAVPQGRAAVRGVMLLPGLVAASQLGPIVASGEPIRHVSLTISSQSGPVYLDVWEPTTAPPPIPGAREGVLIIPGVGDNRTTAQLTNLTESLARAGLVAMTMGTNALFAYVLSPGDSDAVVQAFQTLLHWPGVGATRTGILGFSAGDSLACLAAADPRIASKIAFLTFFGGFYNARDLLGDVGRRSLTENGQPQAWTPDPVPLEVLANTLSGTLSSAEGAEFSAAFRFSNAVPLTPDQVAQLSPPALAAYHLLKGDQPAQVQSNLNALSSAMQQLLQALSPSSVVTELRPPIYLMHDKSDPFVPFTESEDFDAALTRLHHPHDFVAFSIFRHTEVRTSLDLQSLLSDGPRLFYQIYATTQPST